MKLFLVRGLPGSGKTTFAKEDLPYCNLFEADQFFIKQTMSWHVTEEYNWSPEFLHEAHTLCRMNTIKSLYHGNDTVVANTFTTLKELQPYIDLKERFPDLEIVIYEMTAQYQNTHLVPIEALFRMKTRWETLPESDIYKVIQNG